MVSDETGGGEHGLRGAVDVAGASSLNIGHVRVPGLERLLVRKGQSGGRTYIKILFVHLFIPCSFVACLEAPPILRW